MSTVRAWPSGHLHDVPPIRLGPWLPQITGKPRRTRYTAAAACGTQAWWTDDYPPLTDRCPLCFPGLGGDYPVQAEEES